MKRFTQLELMYLTHLIFAIVCFGQCYANGYYHVHGEGWHWYQDSPLIPLAPEKARTLNPTQPTDNATINPNEQMKAWQHQLKTSLNLAILKPTNQNVLQYIRLQQRLSQQASQFSLAWQRALLDEPMLSNEFAYPSTQLGQQVYWQQKSSKNAAILQKLSKFAGILFFYHSRCGYCQQFAPVLKSYSIQTGIKIIPVTIDGKVLAEFSESQQRPALVRALNVHLTPALYLAHPKSGQIIPIGHGVMSQAILTQRLVSLYQQIEQGSSRKTHV